MKFFSRITLICNVCFLLALILKTIKGIDDNQFVTGTIAVLGLLLAVILNVLLLLISLFLFLTKKGDLIPRSLFLINMLCFILQIFYFFYTK
jgi:hypothetical protein